MASEGNASFFVSVTKGNFTDQRQTSHSFDVSGTHVSTGVQNIGTTHEAIAISTDVATLGFGFIRNLDATNYVDVGLLVSGTFYSFHKLKPGEACLGRLGMGNTALYAKANTAACDIEYRIYQD